MDNGIWKYSKSALGHDEQVLKLEEVYFIGLSATSSWFAGDATYNNVY